MKKYLIGMLCMLMLAIGFSANVCAASDFVIEDGVLVGYFGADNVDKVTIPSGVTSIGRNAFEGYMGIKSIVIPSGVTRIEMNAFKDCRSITSIKIPSTVKYIGAAAFASCFELKSITIPNSVTTVMDRAFDGCYALKSAKLSSNMDVIRWGTFRDCMKLEYVIIPVSVTDIKGYAFWNCQKLTDVYYGGTKSQWNRVRLYKEDDGSEKGFAGVNPKIHYSSIAPTIKVKSVSLNAAKARIYRGKQMTLKATVKPSNASNKSVTWHSNNSKVAKVKNGVVTAVSNGTATITVKTKDGGKTAKCKITVYGPISVKSIKLSKKSGTIDLNKKTKSVTLKVTFNPVKATNKKLDIVSSNKKVAKLVSYNIKTGKISIKALSVGKAKFTIKSVDKKKKATFTIKVKDTGRVTGVTMASKASVRVGKTVKVKATVKPATARKKKITYESSDETIATVDASGNIKGISPGNATITATSVDGGRTAKCKVTVTE